MWYCSQEARRILEAQLVGAGTVRCLHLRAMLRVPLHLFLQAATLHHKYSCSVKKLIQN